MTTTAPNVFASPASQPQASVMEQFPQSGVPMTPGQQGIAQFRARGGIPLGGAQKMAAPGMTPPQGGQLGAVSNMVTNAGNLQTAQGLMRGRTGGVGDPNAALRGMYGGPAMTPPQGGPVATPATMPSAQPGQMPGRIRPPTAGFLRPRTMPGPNPITSTY